MNILKNDHELKQKKPKETKHFRKVNDELRQALVDNLETEIPELTRYHRYAKLLDRIPNLNVSVDTIYLMIRIQNHKWKRLNK